MKIIREFHPYRTAFIDERVLAKNELLKSDKASKWKKRKFDASNMFKDINSHDEFEKVAMENNLFPMVYTNLKDIKEETLFPCHLVDGNEAWIGQDSVGKYRYFTGRPFDEAIGYTIFDLLMSCQQVTGIGYTQQLQLARYELFDLLNVSYEEADWERKEVMKYTGNIGVIYQFERGDFQKNYPKLSRKLKTYVDVLDTLLNHGRKFIDITRKDENDNSYFTLFSSQSGVSPERFKNAVKRFRELGLLFVEHRKVEFSNKESYSVAACFSFPLYSEDFFRKIEEKLGTQK